MLYVQRLLKSSAPVRGKGRRLGLRINQLINILFPVYRKVETNFLIFQFLLIQFILLLKYVS